MKRNGLTVICMQIKLTRDRLVMANPDCQLDIQRRTNLNRRNAFLSLVCCHNREAFPCFSFLFVVFSFFFYFSNAFFSNFFVEKVFYTLYYDQGFPYSNFSLLLTTPSSKPFLSLPLSFPSLSMSLYKTETKN